MYMVTTLFFISTIALVIIHFVILFISFLKSKVVTYVSNNIFTIFKFVFAFSIHVTVLVNIANYNVNFVKQIKM